LFLTEPSAMKVLTNSDPTSCMGEERSGQDQDLRLTDNSLNKLNRELMAISSCNQLLVRATDEQTLLNDVCRIICEKAGYMLAWVGYAEHDRRKSVRPMAWYGHNDGYVENANISWDEHSELGQGSTGKAIRSGKSVFSHNLPTDPNYKPWSEEATKRGFQSSIALPMKNDAGKVFGALMLYSSESDILTLEEIRLLEELAGDLAFGVTSIRLRIEHKKALEALEASEAHYHSLFDRVKDGVYRSTHEGLFVDINPAMVSMFGYTDKEEMLKVDIKNDLYFAPEERESSILEIGLSKMDIFRMKRKDGSEIWVEDNGMYELDDQGNTLFHEGILRDVTERVQVEQDLIKAKENAELSDRLKTVFLQNISHEIRTPMNAISGFSSIMNNPDLTQEEISSYTDIVQSNIDRLLSVINDIITISSLQTNQEEVFIQESNINELLDDIYCFYVQRFKEQQCTLTLEKTLDNKRAFVFTDNDKVSHILNKLLSNALKFTHHGEVALGYHLVGRDLEFFVRDSGIGMEPTILEKVFEPFSKASYDPILNSSGTGLGLSISKGYAQLLGGTIRVESKLGKGSVFYFTIPYRTSL